MAIIEVRDEAHWHELRAKHIGGSDVAALFGLSSFSTRWQLWQEKAGNLPAEDLSNNKAVLAGKFLEAGIAEWAAHLWGWDIHKVEQYHTADDTPGMGATLDYALDNGIPLEIKWNCGFSGDWKYESDTIVEAPEKYILQVQHQMACYMGNPEYAWLVVLINNEPRRMCVPRHDGIIDSIKREVSEFWRSIEAGEEPDPDFVADADAIDRLMEQVPYAEIDIGDIPGAEALFRRHKDAKATMKLAEAEADGARAELLLMSKRRLESSNAVTEKAKITCGDHKMSIYKVAASPGKEVTQDMVGTYVGGRKGYQGVRIT